jgi:hypothetical protein
MGLSHCTLHLRSAEIEVSILAACLRVDSHHRHETLVTIQGFVEVLLTFAQRGSMQPLLRSRDSGKSDAGKSFQWRVIVLELPKGLGGYGEDWKHILLAVLGPLTGDDIIILSLSSDEVVTHALLDASVASLAGAMMKPVFQVRHLILNLALAPLVLIKLFVRCFKLLVLYVHNVSKILDFLVALFWVR